MRLSELQPEFFQSIPLATGIFTGLIYTCPADPRRKKRHAVLFVQPINPYPEYAVSVMSVMSALQANEGWSRSPKWTRTGATFETLSLLPSIAWPCCHSTITNGEVLP